MQAADIIIGLVLFIWVGLLLASARIFLGKRKSRQERAFWSVILLVKAGIVFLFWIFLIVFRKSFLAG